MDIQQCITFMSIASERSFIRASQKLGVSQPTVTSRMQTLEEELGEHLVIRTGHEAILTPAGEIFLSYAERAVQVFQSGVDRLNHEPFGHALRIAGTPTFNSYVLPAHAAEFSKLQPDTRLQVLTGSSLNIIHMLQDQVADIGFIQGAIKGYNVIMYPLFSEELHLMVHAEHPLSRRDIVTLSDMQQETFITSRRSTHTWDLIEDRFRQEAFKPSQMMEMDHVSGIRQMLLAGVGAAFLPERVMKDELRRKRVKVLELDGAPIIRLTSAAVPNRMLGAAAAAFLHHMHKAFKLNQVPAEIQRLMAV